MFKGEPLKLHFAREGILSPLFYGNLTTTFSANQRGRLCKQDLTQVI